MLFNPAKVNRIKKSSLYISADDNGDWRKVLKIAISIIFTKAFRETAWLAIEGRQERNSSAKDLLFSSLL